MPSTSMRIKRKKMSHLAHVISPLIRPSGTFEGARKADEG